MELTAKKLQEMTSDSDCIKVVNALFIAVAYCETVRAIIEPKQQEVIDFYKFPVKKEWIEKYDEDLKFIDSEKHMYLAEDDDFQIYMKEMDKFHKEQGFKKPSYEYCPLLMSESTVRDVKIQVCDFLEPWIGLKYSDISRRLDTYKQYFDLIMTMFSEPVKEYQKGAKVGEVVY